MARGGARPGAGRPAGKSANTSPPSPRARARAREAAGNQRPWPADKVERWRIDRLIPYAIFLMIRRQPRAALFPYTTLFRSWTTPALVGEDGGLIAGHARVLAARQLGIAEDPELLRLELGELKLSGFDLSLTGFGDLELPPGSSASPRCR